MITVSNSCNCLQVALQEGANSAYRPLCAKFGSETQLRLAEVLARSFGHEWAGVEPYDYDDGELTTYDIYLTTLRRRGKHEAWQHGLSVPNFDGDVVVHRTREGLGSLGWRIYPSGEVDAAIYRPIQIPPVLEVRLDCPEESPEPFITVTQHRVIETRHWVLVNQVVTAVSEYWRLQDVLEYR
jgi:hypothetical protein